MKNPDKDVRVTVIGGGTGSFNVLLGLRRCDDISIQSIVTMMDSGGDSGRLRDEFGVLPPGDLRQCLVALSEEDQILRDLFTYRFTDPPLENRSFGNLFFLALTKVLGSEREAVEAMSRILKVRGRVLAVTWDRVHLHAELEDGSVIAGEGNIDVPKHDPSIPIRRVFLEPEARANPDAIQAIEESDFVVIAPGNLYTSIVPNLLVQGIPEALGRSGGQVIYIMNLMTKYGETDGYTALDHVERFARYARRLPDAVLIHEGPVPPDLLKKYEEEHAGRVEPDAEALRAAGVHVVLRRDVMSAASLVRHDPERTANSLVELFQELRPMARNR